MFGHSGAGLGTSHHHSANDDSGLRGSSNRTEGDRLGSCLRWLLEDCSRPTVKAVTGTQRISASKSSSVNECSANRDFPTSMVETGLRCLQNWRLEPPSGQASRVVSRGSHCSGVRVVAGAATALTGRSARANLLRVNDSVGHSRPVAAGRFGIA